MATTPKATPLSFSSVLRVRTMRRLWYAQIISVFGDFLPSSQVLGLVSPAP